jgi:glycosyltransferase involved in cell wall biosynthesis
MRGFWADERVDGKIWNLNTLFFRVVYNYFKKKEKQFIHESNHIIALTEQSRSIINSWFVRNVQPTAITVIPCCVDLNHFNSNAISNSDKLNLRDLLNISNSTRVISYVGSIGTWYMLPEMLAFFVRWLLIYPDSIFLFISQEDPQIILREATLQGVSHDNIRINSVSRAEMPLYISISDFSLFFIKPFFSKIASSPTKLGEIMAMGVPVICNIGIGDTDMIVRASNSGLLVDQFIESAYDQVISEYHLANFDSSTTRKGAVHHFSLDEGIHRYKTVYERLLSVP